MSKKRTEYLLIACILTGVFTGYFIISTFIVNISFGKYLLIELIISLLHELYNYTKRQAVKHIHHE
jgi:hypothetical protein